MFFLLGNYRIGERIFKTGYQNAGTLFRKLAFSLLRKMNLNMHEADLTFWQNLYGRLEV